MVKFVRLNISSVDFFTAEKNPVPVTQDLTQSHACDCIPCCNHIKHRCGMQIPLKWLNCVTLHLISNSQFVPLVIVYALMILQNKFPSAN